MLKLIFHLIMHIMVIVCVVMLLWEVFHGHTDKAILYGVLALLNEQKE